MNLKSGHAFPGATKPNSLKTLEMLIPKQDLKYLKRIPTLYWKEFD